MKYLIESRDGIHAKGCKLLSTAKKMGKNLSSKYGQKLIDSTKNLEMDAFKTALKKSI